MLFRLQMEIYTVIYKLWNIVKSFFFVDLGTCCVGLVLIILVYTGVTGNLSTLLRPYLYIYPSPTFQPKFYQRNLQPPPPTRGRAVNIFIRKPSAYINVGAARDFFY